MTVDFVAETASFGQVDATLSDAIYYYDFDLVHRSTENLGELFRTTELLSTSVSTSEINFFLDYPNPTFPGADINMTLTFSDNLVYVSGHFADPGYDPDAYTLDGVAVLVPEPAAVCLFGLGATALIRKRRRNKKQK